MTSFCRICNIGLHDMMTAVVILKEFEKRGLITEVVKGVWIRSPSGALGDAHGMLCSVSTFLSLIKFLQCSAFIDGEKAYQSLWHIFRD